MELQEHFGKNLSKKNILVTWAKGTLARSWYSTQEILLMSSRMGMNVILAHPEKYQLDPLIIEQAKENCGENNTTFSIIHNPEEGYSKTDVVYSRNWISPQAYEDKKFNREKEIKKALNNKYSNWICDTKKMSKTNNGIFIHPMPINRNQEVTDEVVSKNSSLIYNIAENRVHVQKAILALTMNKDFTVKNEI